MTQANDGSKLTEESGPQTLRAKFHSPKLDANDDNTGEEGNSVL